MENSKQSIPGLVIASIVGGLVGMGLGGYGGFKYGVSLILNRALKKDAGDIQTYVDTLNHLRNNKIDRAVEGVENLLDDSLIIFDPADPYPGLENNTIFEIKKAFVKSKEERAQGNERWERVQELVHSPDAGNWRLAILEADIMLTDIVARMGYSGERLGEQLKQVEKSDFTTLDKAWEAHKIRNTIAHEGGDFILTQREARRVIVLYEDVFREFHYI